MSEFDPPSQEELKGMSKTLKSWKCENCGAVGLDWEEPKECYKCHKTSFREVVRVNTVGAETGFFQDLTYDNIDTIADSTQDYIDREDQNRDLDKLEKNRR